MIIVPTRTVADDAMRALDIPADRIEVIPEAAAPVFWCRPQEEVAAVRERYGLPDQYLLWVGTMRRPDPRKRLAGLTRAGRSLPLVLVGPVSRWARELPGVQLTGAVPDDELAAIYSGAHALVFPSDEEGFGLPPVEALACGTPVAACDVPALREVLAGRITLSAVDDLDALVRHAEGLTRPVAPAPVWTWNDVAAATCEVYERALVMGAPRRRPPQGATRRPSGAERRRRD
jgi:alpha-1,3-rhamnosyl/mannosyltransferase